MNHEPLLPLGRAWLDELRALGIITDETSAQARAKLIPRANAAARQIDEEWKSREKSGDMKALAKVYRDHRDAQLKDGKRPLPWWKFLHDRKVIAIRVLARANAQKFRWQPIRDMKKDA